MDGQAARHFVFYYHATKYKLSTFKDQGMADKYYLKKCFLDQKEQRVARVDKSRSTLVRNRLSLQILSWAIVERSTGR